MKVSLGQVSAHCTHSSLQLGHLAQVILQHLNLLIVRLAIRRLEQSPVPLLPLVHLHLKFDDFLAPVREIPHQILSHLFEFDDLRFRRSSALLKLLDGLGKLLASVLLRGGAGKHALRIKVSAHPYDQRATHHSR